MCHGTYEHDGVPFLLQISCNVLDSMQKHCAADGSTYSFHVFLEWSYVTSIGDTGGIKGRKKMFKSQSELLLPYVPYLFCLLLCLEKWEWEVKSSQHSLLTKIFFSLS